MENKAVAFIKSNEWFKSTMVEHGTHNGMWLFPLRTNIMECLILILMI